MSPFTVSNICAHAFFSWYRDIYYISWCSISAELKWTSSKQIWCFEKSLDENSKFPKGSPIHLQCIGDGGSPKPFWHTVQIAQYYRSLSCSWVLPIHWRRRVRGRTGRKSPTRHHKSRLWTGCVNRAWASTEQCHHVKWDDVFFACTSS